MRRAHNLGLVAVAAVLALSARAGDLGTPAQQAAGKQVYDKYCAQCHGVQGDGVGYSPSRLKPRPRDFTAGKYKFRTTPSGMLPTDADLTRVIRQGLPYTSMPGWPNLSDEEVRDVIYHLKTFSDAFGNPDKEAAAIEIPEPPPISEESVTRGRQVYEAQGCAACHGDLGRGDGRSAPTLKDDWGQHIRPADLSERWTFRGGPTRRDIFRTFSTGVNGTPMPSYADSLAVEDRWDLVNYIHSLGDGDEPGYDNLLLVTHVDDELDLGRADELFANAPPARFPLVGQIVEPGRNFYPSATSIVLQAVYNRSEIAFRLSWDDMRAELAGTNSPLLEVPLWPEEAEPAAAGGEEGGDFWGEEAAPAEAGGDFWGEEEGPAEPAAAGGAFSDAVALQLPAQLPSGVRKPYFIFGDADHAVDLWFLDLARETAEQFAGRGSANVAPATTDEIAATKSYDAGRWRVVFKRALRSNGNLTFQEGQYVPIAFSVWDGFNEERGNKRALSSWFYLYVTPAERVSALGPMVRVGLGVLAVEILILLFLRRRYGSESTTPRPEGRRVVAGA